MLHGQELSVTPHVGGPGRQGLLVDGGGDGVEVVANEERLAGVRETVELARLVVFAGGAALEMGDWRGPIGGQILEVIHAAEANPGAAGIPPPHAAHVRSEDRAFPRDILAAVASRPYVPSGSHHSVWGFTTRLTRRLAG